MDIKGTTLYCILFQLVASTAVQAFPTGAPAEACVDIYPVGHAETADSRNLGSNPFRLSLSDLDHSRGGSAYYLPGKTYTLTLSGSGGEQFRGFLVQARTVADGSPVGVFTDNGDDQKLSLCSPEQSAVTHPNRDLKSAVTLLWTAPPDGSGQLHILFAVVSEFNQSRAHSIFWAPATTDTILPCGPPLYLYQGNCVEMCPLQHIANHTSGLCEPFSSDYILSLNATQYYANLNSETPLNTTAFHIQLSINLDLVTLSDIDELTFRFFQNQLVQDLFEFEESGESNRFVATDYIQAANDETGVVNAPINLVTLPEDSLYPIEIYMTVLVSLLYSTSIASSTTAKAVGSIVLAPGACEFHACQNGGTCMDTNSTYYICHCPPEFTGQTCGEVVDVCQWLEPCVNGTCNPIYSTEYTCTCFAGYTGDNCSEHICDQLFVCSNGVCTVGEKDGNIMCDCDSGYTGRNCDKVVSDCYSDGCNGNGNCTDFNGESYCKCYPEWTGTQCEMQIICNPNPCENGATCSVISGIITCVCIPGWTGTYCETLIRGCGEKPCYNNATCIGGCRRNEKCSNETRQQYSCLCVPGFTGDTCTEDDPTITFCRPDSCINSGTCIEEYGPSVSCVCSHEFTGPVCAEDVSTDDSCTQRVFDRTALICAVAAVLIVAMTGTFITIVLAVRYQTKARVRRFNQNQVSNDLTRETSYRVFPNTNIDTGIYFDCTDEYRPSPVIGNESLTMSSSLNTQSQPTSELPLLPRYRGSVSSQQNSDTQEQTSQTITSNTISQMTVTPSVTSVSDYEQPIRHYVHASHSIDSNYQHSSLSSHYEIVH